MSAIESIDCTNISAMSSLSIEDIITTKQRKSSFYASGSSMKMKEKMEELITKQKEQIAKD